MNETHVWKPMTHSGIANREQSLEQLAVTILEWLLQRELPVRNALLIHIHYQTNTLAQLILNLIMNRI